MACDLVIGGRRFAGGRVRPSLELDELHTLVNVPIIYPTRLKRASRNVDRRNSPRRALASASRSPRSPLSACTLL